MKPKVAPKSITPSIPTFRTPERWPTSSPRAAKVKIVEASRLLARNSHMYSLLFFLFPDELVSVEELKSHKCDHQNSEQGIIQAKAHMEFSLGESAADGQSSEKQCHRNRRQRIAQGN